MFIHGWVWDLRKYLSWIGEVYNSPPIHTKYKFKLWLFYLYFHYKVCLWWSIVPFCNKLKCIEVSNIRSLLLSDSLRIDLVYTWNMCYYDGVAFGTENLLTTKYHTFSIGHFFRQFSLHYHGWLPRKVYKASSVDTLFLFLNVRRFICKEYDIMIIRNSKT